MTQNDDGPIYTVTAYHGGALEDEQYHDDYHDARACYERFKTDYPGATVHLYDAVFNNLVMEFIGAEDAA